MMASRRKGVPLNQRPAAWGSSEPEAEAQGRATHRHVVHQPFRLVVDVEVSVDEGSTAVSATFPVSSTSPVVTSTLPTTSLAPTRPLVPAAQTYGVIDHRQAFDASCAPVVDDQTHAEARHSARRPTRARAGIATEIRVIREPDPVISRA